MPERKGWLTPEEAAKLWNELVGLSEATVNRPISGQVVRKLCREGRMAALGIEVQEWPGRWYLSKYDIVRRVHEYACAACRRTEAMLAEAEEQY